MSARIPALEAARAVAALGVVAFHWWVLHERAGTAVDWANAAGYGWVGVQLFFVLSGFVLFAPYAGGDRLVDLASYGAGRALRILPAWWAAVVAGGLVLGTSWSWANLGELAFLQRVWVPAADPAPVGWTLVAEVGFYAVLPLLVWVGYRWRLLRTPVLVGLVLVGWTLIQLPMATALTPIAFVDQFAWGMLASLAVARGCRVPGAVAVLALIAAAADLALAPSSLASPYGFPYANLLSPCFALVVAWLAGAGLRPGRGVVWLGTISFGIYLWHLPLLVILDDHGLTRLPDLVELAVVLGGAVVLGWLSWRLVERPALAQRHRLASRLRTAGRAGEDRAPSRSPRAPAVTDVTGS